MRVALTASLETLLTFTGNIVPFRTEDFCIQADKRGQLMLLIEVLEIGLDFVCV